jgi:hypothetical protein
MRSPHRGPEQRKEEEDDNGDAVALVTMARLAVGFRQVDLDEFAHLPDAQASTGIQNRMQTSDYLQ